MTHTSLQAGSSVYYSLLFSTPEQRTAINALYQFQQQISRVVDECRETSTAQHKLEWWRSELERLFQGESRHPATKTLQPIVQQWSLPEKPFRHLIEAAEMDLTYSRYRSFDDLKPHCEKNQGALQQLISTILSDSPTSLQNYTQTLGTALQLTHNLRNLHHDAQRGRIYLPLEELEQCKITPAELLQPKATPPARLAELLALQASRIRSLFQHALQELPNEARYAQRPGLVLINLHQTLLNEMEQAGYPLLQQRISLTPLRKLWLAWNTARKEKKQYEN